MPGENSKPAVAFLSYAHRDDQQTAGKITQLREALQLAVSSVVGRDFAIFQDTDAIAWGKQWRGRLDEALGQAQFLIPIITPSYFSSKPCRDELEKFEELERRAGRSDLILPLYFRTVRDFNSSDDPLVQLISRRQYRDWREFRNRRLDDPQIQQEIDQLADELGEAIASSPEAKTRPESSTPEADAPRSTPLIVAKPASADQMSELYARLDRFERELVRRDEEISGLRSARTTLQEELAEALQERPTVADAASARDTTRHKTVGRGGTAGTITGCSIRAAGRPRDRRCWRLAQHRDRE